MTVQAVPAFVFGQDMRIKDIAGVRDGVVYIGLERDGLFTPYGSGFLVNLWIDKEWRVICVVTALHVIQAVPGETVYVRLNRKVGGAASVPIESKQILGWQNNDLAIFGINLGTDIYDYKALDVDEGKLLQARYMFEGITYGDEVYAVGLYTSHYGLTRNVPIVRIGHVALLPGGEPVRGPGGYVDAYLIELRTIAGLSGSPVYLNPPEVRVKGKKFQYLDGNWYLPIGILVGYHVVESKEDQVVVAKWQTPQEAEEPKDTYSLDQRNTGFGIVIPFEKVVEMLKGMKPGFKAYAEQLKKNTPFRPASVSSADTNEVVSAPPSTSENPKHLEDFTSLVSEAARKPKQDD